MRKVKGVFIIAISIGVVFGTVFNPSDTIAPGEVVKVDMPLTFSVVEEISLPVEEKEKKALDGIIITIDPGHGETDYKIKEPIAPGAVEMKAGNVYGTTGVSTNIPEHELNLKVSFKIKSRLEELGATCLMTRDTVKSTMTNVERAIFGNESGSHLALRIHADAINRRDIRGASVLIPGSGYIKDEYMLVESERAGIEILNAYCEATGFKNRGKIVKNDITGFNWSTIPVVLLEMGFMSNPEEDRLMNDEAFQEKMVDGIVEGILNYFAESE